jgi:tetratricopeptide (TPR) repeat protein
MGLSAVCFLRAKVRVWYLIGWYFHWRMDVVEIAAPVAVGLWAGWELLQGMFWTGLGIATSAAHWAHIGGFAVGLTGAFALKLRRRVVYTDLIEGRRPTTTQTEAFAQVAELERIVAKSPEDGEAWYSLGRAREVGGRGEDALAAYLRSLECFLRQRQAAGTVKAYRGIKEHASVSWLPESLLFPLASALEDEGQHADAFEAFRRVAMAAPHSPEAETALARAAEAARRLPDHRQQEADCYRALLEDFSHSRWRGLAQRRLREIGPVAPAQQPAAQERPEMVRRTVADERAWLGGQGAAADPARAQRQDGLSRLGEAQRPSEGETRAEAEEPRTSDGKAESADRKKPEDRRAEDTDSVSRFDRLERLPRDKDERAE